MRHTPREFVSLAFLATASVLAACQGNIGGGSGLSIPQAPGYQQPAGPNGSNAQSRQRLLDGAVYLSSKLSAVPLPVVAGYSVSIALGTPGPVTAASPSPSGSEAAGSAHALKGKAVKAAALAAAAKSAGHAAASPSSSASAAATGSPSPDVSASGSASPEASAEGSASPKSPAPKSTEPAAEGSAAPESSASPAAKGAKSPSPATTGSSLPRFETKTIVDPDDAPPPPTPMPTGEVQTFVKRSAIIRGYVLSGADLPLYGLGAIRFTMPASEITPKRGFTIALFESGKHHHEKLISYDNEPTITDTIVYSSMTSPLTLKKGSGYLLMIYGDDELVPATTPPSVPPGYPGPGNNPFPVGSGNPQPSYSQVPGYPAGANQTPYPGQQTPYQILPTTKPT